MRRGDRGISQGEQGEEKSPANEFIVLSSRASQKTLAHQSLLKDALIRSKLENYDRSKVAKTMVLRMFFSLSLNRLWP